MSSKQSLIENWKVAKIVTNKHILESFEKVPRENFVIPEYKDQAYSDTALSHLSNQSISQPTTIMIMTQALNPKPRQKILEIGTGSGYQAAILSKIYPSIKVYTTEIIKELYEFSKEKLKSYKNVKVYLKDGSLGIEKFAPFDRIIITASCPSIPEPLLKLNI